MLRARHEHFVSNPSRSTLHEGQHGNQSAPQMHRRENSITVRSLTCKAPTPALTCNDCQNSRRASAAVNTHALFASMQLLWSGDAASGKMVHYLGRQFPQNTIPHAWLNNVVLSQPHVGPATAATTMKHMQCTRCLKVRTSISRHDEREAISPSFSMSRTYRGMYGVLRQSPPLKGSLFASMLQ